VDSINDRIDIKTILKNTQIFKQLGLVMIIYPFLAMFFSAHSVPPFSWKHTLTHCLIFGAQYNLNWNPRQGQFSPKLRCASLALESPLYRGQNGGVG